MVLLMNYSQLLIIILVLCTAVTGCKISVETPRLKSDRFAEPQVQDSGEPSIDMNPIEDAERDLTSQGVKVSKCAPGPWKWWRDSDGDGYGDGSSMIKSCEIPDGYVDNNRDCDDQDPSINPLALESHTDMIDNDCNGVIATTRPISNSVCHGYYEDQRDTTTRLQVIKLDQAPSRLYQRRSS